MHKSKTASHIKEILTIFNDRLQNEMTRDATLKAITKLCLNEESMDKAVIQMTDLKALLPRMFDLMHKT